MPAHVGDRCVVLAPLHPSGVVRVGGDRRGARALVGAIDPGTEAVVVGWDPFGLIVRPAADVPDPARLPNTGAVCPSPQELAERREAEADEVRRGSFWAEYRAEVGDRLFAVLPVTVVAAGVGWWWVGVPGVVVGGLAAVLVASLILAWMVLN